MPRRVKSVSREVRAAIGELVIEVTFVQYLAARLVAVAGIADKEMSLLQPSGKPFELARKATRTFKNPQVAGRTRSWLREVRSWSASAMKWFTLSSCTPIELACPCITGGAAAW